MRRWNGWGDTAHSANGPVPALAGLCRHFDPAGIMNPGKPVAGDQRWAR